MWIIIRLCVAGLLYLQLLPVQAQSGAQVAQQLNARFASTSTTCVGGLAPFNCSGVLARPLSDAHPSPFWKHDATAVAQGYERFTLLRKHTAPARLAGKSGYVLLDRLSAVGRGTPYQGFADPAGDLSEVRVSNWNELIPADVAVQALYYESGAPSDLARAQRHQLAYHQATGRWLPIMRLNLADPHGKVFGFVQQEQLDNGFRVAERLNRRYVDTPPACRDGRAAFYCRGVLIRGVQGSAAFRAWNPSANSVSRNGVSFSYVRADVGTVRLAGTEGLIFREAGAPVQHPLTLRCAYPANASTSSIAGSCRASCESQGIVTVAAWQRAHGASPGGSCAFTPSVAQFQLNIDVRANNGAWNEIIIAAWPQNIGQQLPLEAVFYISGSGGLNGARLIQRDYYLQAGKVLPVVRVDLSAINGRIAAFDPQDQNL